MPQPTPPPHAGPAAAGCLGTSGRGAGSGAHRARRLQIEGLPATVRRAGPQAAERTVEFFTAQIRNPHTRAAVVPRLDAPPYRPPQPTLRRV